MRLNHDCIRDILLYVEETITDEVEYADVENLASELNAKYDIGIINYHVRQIHNASLVESVFYSGDSPQLIADLTWEGHEYVDNIRDTKVWKKLKDSSKHLASISLPIMVEQAANLIKSFLSSP